MDFEASRTGSQTAGLRDLVEALRDRAYQFVAITPATHRTINARTENVWARGMRDVFGWSRPFTTPVLDPGLFAFAQAAGVLAPLPGQAPKAWRSLVRAATLHDMIFLHSAFPTEAPDAVFFGPDTYRFAAAIALHLRESSHDITRAIDIGAGAGAGGIIIARAFPAAEIILSDINQAALAVAQVNALSAGVTNARCRLADLFDGIDGAFDLIVANPPYLVDPLARAYRHGGGPLGAGLSIRIVKESLPRLSPSGSLVLYTGSAIVDGEDKFLASITQLLRNTGCIWDYREADPDVFGEEMSVGPYRHADRIAAVVLTVQRQP